MFLEDKEQQEKRQEVEERAYGMRMGRVGVGSQYELMWCVAVSLVCGIRDEERDMAVE